MFIIHQLGMATIPPIFGHLRLRRWLYDYGEWGLSMVYGRYTYSIHGVYKATRNWSTLYLLVNPTANR